MFSARKISVQPHHMAWQLVSRAGLIIAEGEQHNIVLNQAADLMAVHGMDGITNFAVIGTGTTAPSVTQTGLVAEVARTNANPSGLPDEITRVSNGVYNIKRIKQFGNIGSLNLTEWGFSPSNTPGNNLAVRELFRDGSNNSIPITPTDDQFLRLSYTTQVTLTPVVGTPANINIVGIGIRTGRLWLSGFNYQGFGFADFQAINALMTGSYKFYVHDQRFAENYGTQAYGTLYPRPIRNAAIYVAGSKTRVYPDVEFGVNDLNATIVGFGVGQDIQNGLIFNLDDGQEFTKDNAHKIILGSFGVSWT